MAALFRVILFLVFLTPAAAWPDETPDRIAELMKQGDAAFQVKRFDDALSAYQQASILDPKSSAAFIGYCKTLIEQSFNSVQIPEDSAAFVLQQKEGIQDNAEAEYWAGRVLMLFERYEEANRFFERSIEIQPTYDAFNFQATVLYNLRRYHDSSEALRKALELRPGDHSAMIGLVASLQKEDLYEESLKYAEELLAQPDVQESLLSSAIGLAGLSYITLGRYQRAGELYRRAQKICKDTGAYYRYGIITVLLVEMLLDQGEYRAAMQEISAIQEIPFDRVKLSQAVWLKYSFHLKTGLSLYSLREYDSALKSYEEALRFAAQTKPESDQAAQFTHLYGNIAEVYENKGDYPKAAEWTEKSLKLLEGFNRLYALHKLTALRRRLGDFDEYEKLFQEFMVIAGRLQTPEDRSTYLVDVARMHEERSEFQEALKLNLERLEILRIKQRPIPLADGHSYVGNDYVYLGRYEEALEHFQTALQLYEEVPSPRQVAYSYRRMGDIYLNLGDYKKAAGLFEDSANLFLKIGRRDSAARSLWSLGWLEYSLGSIDAAQQRLDEVLKIFRELGHRVEEAGVYSDLGAIQEESENYSAALELHMKSLSLKQESGAILSSIASLTNAGRQNFFLKNYEWGEALMKKALEISNRSRWKYSYIQESLAELELHRSRPEKAEEYLKEALQIDAELGNLMNWSAWYLLSEAQKKQGQSNRALESLRKSLQIVERIRTATLGLPEDHLFLRKYRKVYRSLIDLLIDKNQLEEAYEVIEREKIAELRENETMRGVSNNNVAQEALKKGRELQFRISGILREIQGESQQTPPDEERIRDLNRLLGAVDREFFDYLAKLESEHPDIYTRLKKNPQELRSIRRSLPENVVLLQPVLLPDRLAILVHTQAASRVREIHLQQRTQIDEEIGHFLDLLRSQQSSTAEIQESSSALYEYLIRPVESEICSSCLLIVSPSGKLRRIPFAALYDRKEKQYLIEKFPIVHLAFLDERKNERSEPDELSIFAMANPDGSLPGAEDQVKRISESFPSARVLIGEEATVESLRWRNDDNHYNVLLFATHAEMDDEQPRNSHIRLAGYPQKLTCAELPEFDRFWPNVKLVVLSACETAAVIPANENSALMDLAGILDGMGIPSVVASLWKVPDASTADLIARFFNHLKAGDSQAASLQKAQIELIHSQNYNSPFHWGAFLLFGDWQ